MLVFFLFYIQYDAYVLRVKFIKNSLSGYCQYVVSVIYFFIRAIVLRGDVDLHFT